MKKIVPLPKKGLKKEKTVPERYEIAVGDKVVMTVQVPPETTPRQLVNHLINLATMISVENGLAAEDAVEYMSGQFEDLILCRE